MNKLLTILILAMVLTNETVWCFQKYHYIYSSPFLGIGARNNKNFRFRTMSNNGRQFVDLSSDYQITRIFSLNDKHKLQMTAATRDANYWLYRISNDQKILLTFIYESNGHQVHRIIIKRIDRNRRYWTENSFYDARLTPDTQVEMANDGTFVYWKYDQLCVVKSLSRGQLFKEFKSYTNVQNIDIS